MMAGCGKGYVPMGGRVTYSDTGEPLERGTVSFATDSTLSRGAISEDGRYKIGTFSTTDGLPKGEYRVYITGAARIEGPEGKQIEIPLIDPKYENVESSEFLITVDGSQRQFDFSVDRIKPEQLKTRRAKRSSR